MSDSDFSAHSQAVEGIARVVAVDGRCAWLEPEQGGSCSGCSSLAACGEKGMGTLASRLEDRRFPLPHPDNAPRFEVGERIVVAVSANALVKGSLTAYLIPMVTLFVAAGTAQSLYGRDGLTMLAAVGGLFAGVVLAWLVARRMDARGEISPRYLRRVNAGAACHPIHFHGVSQ